MLLESLLALAFGHFAAAAPVDEAIKPIGLSPISSTMSSLAAVETITPKETLEFLPIPPDSYPDRVLPPQVTLEHFEPGYPPLTQIYVSTSYVPDPNNPGYGDIMKWTSLWYKPTHVSATPTSTMVPNHTWPASGSPSPTPAPPSQVPLPTSHKLSPYTKPFWWTSTEHGDGEIPHLPTPPSLHDIPPPPPPTFEPSPIVLPTYAPVPHSPPFPPINPYSKTGIHRFVTLDEFQRILSQEVVCIPGFNGEKIWCTDILVPTNCPSSERPHDEPAQFWCGNALECMLLVTKSPHASTTLAKPRLTEFWSDLYPTRPEVRPTDYLGPISGPLSPMQLNVDRDPWISGPSPLHHAIHKPTTETPPFEEVPNNLTAPHHRPTFKPLVPPVARETAAGEHSHRPASSLPASIAAHWHHASPSANATAAAAPSITKAPKLTSAAPTTLVAKRSTPGPAHAPVVNHCEAPCLVRAPPPHVRIPSPDARSAGPGRPVIVHTRLPANESNGPHVHYTGPPSSPCVWGKTCDDGAPCEPGVRCKEHEEPTVPLNAPMGEEMNWPLREPGHESLNGTVLPTPIA